MAEEKKRRCIGVLIAKISKQYQKDILSGIYKAAFENDMNVAVFSTISKSRELDIFTLPDYEKLSGVIYVPYTFEYNYADDVIRPRLEKAAEEHDFPVVVLDKEIEGFSSVMCNDTGTVGEVLRHVINVHGCKDIAFMTGIKGHMHAESRLKVYREVMAENNLPILPGREYYGDFWFNEGGNFLDSLIASENGLPEAIVCANSYMACSVYRELQKREINAPDDIILAHYSDDLQMFKFITGAVKDTAPAGYRACQSLIDMINGKKEKENITIECGCRMNPAITCGCTPVSRFDISEGSIEEDDYFSEFNMIVTDLLSRKNFQDLFWGINWYTCHIKDIDGIYFCLRDKWEVPCFEMEQETVGGYTDRMRLYYKRINFPDGTAKADVAANEYFPVKEMLPIIFRGEGEPSSFIFRPLTFGDKSFGYAVIDNGSRIKTYDSSYDFWLKDVSNALEAQRRLQNMKYMYVSDLMTGIYNRNGFNNMMPEMINNASENGKQLFAALFDLNGMKFINDTFGHTEGDSSIKTAADIISEIHLETAEDERNFRIGGDEFVKAAIGSFSEEDVKEFRRRIEERVTEYNKNSGKAYPIYISTGICIKSPEDEYTLDSIISEADSEMFLDKARIRKATGFDPKRKVN